MRRTTSLRRAGLAGLALTAGVLAGTAVVSGSRGSGLETQAPHASPAGDARSARVPRHRAEVSETGQGAAIDERGTESPGLPEPSSHGPPPPERRLLIVSPDGIPIEDVVVWPHGRRTREDGVAYVPMTSDEAPPFEVSFFDGRDVRRISLDSPDTQVVAEHLPILDVEVIDASTGRAVPDARAYVALGGTCGSYETRVDPSRPLRMPLSVARDGRAWVRVDPPDGFGTMHGFKWSGAVSREARRVRIVAPVWPETTRTLRLVDHWGAPVDGARVGNVSLHSDHRAETSGTGSWVTYRSWSSDAAGLLTMSRLPSLPVSTVTIHVARDADSERGIAEVLGRVSKHRLDLSRPTDPIELRLTGRHCGNGGMASEVPPDSREPDDPPPPPEGDWHNIGDAPPVARANSRTVRVCVVDCDGRRVAGARVSAFHLTDSQIGGPPLGLPVAQLAGDVQTLTPRTGPDGVVDLAVPAGTICYDVTLAGALARFESADDVVTVVLRAPE